MAKISFGNQSGDSKFRLDVLTDGASNTEIAVGDQSDRSVRDAHIVDLPPGLDLRQLAGELARMQAKAGGAAGGSEAAGHLQRAQEAARAGDRPATVNWLQKAGKWGLELAKTVGANVAETAIKAALGL
jgi:hypothetical protein